MPSKYDPLTQYLTQIDKGAVRMTFSKLEEILGFALPASAFKYTAWWANHERGHYHAAAWMAAGWRKTNHSWLDKWVEFTKD
jgi:hypothetical protein